MKIPEIIYRIHSLDENSAPCLYEINNRKSILETIIKPLFKELGYEKKAEIKYELKVGILIADAVVYVNKTPRILIEIKAYEESMDSKLEEVFQFAREIKSPYVFITNGHVFHIYKTDITNVIHPEDRLIYKFQRNEIIDRWNEFYFLLSYKNILRGTFLNYVKKREQELSETVVPKVLSEHLKRARDVLLPEIEKAIMNLKEKSSTFLEELNKWIKNKNQSNSSEINSIRKLAKIVVYNLLTKIYFCKILEDKGKIERKLTSEKIKDSNFDIKQIISNSFKEVLKIDYRAIFEKRFFDSIFPENDLFLIDIVTSLNKFDFAKINCDILGRIYEHHIDKEERKELGQYYTPIWIINYILNAIDLDTNSKILDPACGSGGFLINAYDILLEKYLEKGYSKELAHEKIITCNLYGYDINPFAVMLSAANLALKNIDVSTNDINVFEHDSLRFEVVQYFSGLKKQDIDTKNEKLNNQTISNHLKKFDIIIGNPPYFTIKKKNVQDFYVKVFSPYEEIMGKGSINVVSLFIVKFLELLKIGGILGFVVPKALTYLDSWKLTRRYILQNSIILKILDLREAFEDVRLEMIVILLKKKSPKQVEFERTVKVDYLVSRSSRKLNHEKIKTLDVEHKEFTEKIFPIYRGGIKLSIFKKMNSESRRLGEICYINRGPPLNKKEIKKLWLSYKINDSCVPLLRGRDVQQYYFKPKYWIDEKLPALDSMRNSFEIRTKPKIFVQRLVAQTKDHIKILANYDSGKYLPANTIIYILDNKSQIDLFYLLGVLNSKLSAFYMYNFIFNRATRSMDFSYVKEFPIKKINDTLVSVISDKVKNIIQKEKQRRELELKGEKIPEIFPEKIKIRKEISAILRSINKLKHEIDKLVFELYGLDQSEIQHVLEQK
ncbi:MAG: N-6 DNA methylase [Candidatus Heimdallarchaeaceae archaeon]